jgi:hypothetical protein
MKLRVLVLHSQVYSMPDERNPGAKNEGVSLSYLMPDEAEDSPDRKGVEVQKGSVPILQQSALRTVPGFYDVEFKMSSVTNKQGNRVPGLKPVSLTYASPVRFVGESPAAGPR